MIIDEFDGKGRREVRAYLHFDSAVTLHDHDAQGQSCVINIYGSRALLSFDIPDEMQIRCHDAVDQLSWQITSYGRRYASQTLELVGCIDLPAKLKYVISWDK